MTERTTEKEIDGTTFAVGYLPPQVASDLAVDLFKSLGPAFVLALTEANKARGGAEDASVANAFMSQDLGPVVESLVKTLDKATLNDAIKKLSEVTTVTAGGTKSRLDKTFNILFTGKIGLMYRWLWFALTVNFADFMPTAPSN